MSQGKVIIGFSRHGNIADISFGRFLVAFELFDRGLDNMLFRLCALIYHVQIRSFKMNAQDFSAFIAVFHHFGYVGYRFCKNLFALRDGGGQKTGHAFADYIFCPVTQPLFIGIIRIKAVCAVAVDIQESGNDPQIFVIDIGGPTAVRKDICNFAIPYIKLGCHKLICNPHFFTLN